MDSFSESLPLSRRAKVELITRFANEVFDDRKRKKKSFTDADAEITKGRMMKLEEKLKFFTPTDFGESESTIRRKCVIHKLFPLLIEKEINAVDKKFVNYVWLKIHELEKDAHPEEWPSAAPEIEEPKVTLTPQMSGFV